MTAYLLCQVRALFQPLVHGQRFIMHCVPSFHILGLFENVRLFVVRVAFIFLNTLTPQRTGAKCHIARLHATEGAKKKNVHFAKALTKLQSPPKRNRLVLTDGGYE
jgi:hypothetical protein